jgi:hypothetical protein
MPDCLCTPQQQRLQLVPQQRASAEESDKFDFGDHYGTSSTPQDGVCSMSVASNFGNRRGHKGLFDEA